MCHAIKLAELSICCREGKWKWLNVPNCAVHLFLEKHRAYRISIHPDSAASDKGLVKRSKKFIQSLLQQDVKPSAGKEPWLLVVWL